MADKMAAERAAAAEIAPRVRLAEPKDETALFALMLQFHDESPVVRVIPVCRTDVEAQIALGTRRQGGFIGVVDDPEGGLIGTVGLFPQKWWWSDLWYFEQLWTYVLPRARSGGRVAEALFLWANAVRAEMEARMPAAARPFVTCRSHIHGERIEARDRYWGRWAKRVGSFFIEGLP